MHVIDNDRERPAEPEAIRTGGTVPMSNSKKQSGLSPLSLRINSVWTIFGNGVYAACQWALIVVLAKLSDPGTVGLFALGAAIAVPTVMLTNLQLRAVQATDAREEYAFGTYFSLRLVSGFLALAVIAAIAGVAVSGWEARAVIVLVGVSRVVESLSDIAYGLMQRSERMDFIAKSLVVRAPLGLLLFGAGFWATEDLRIALLGLIVGSALGFVSIDIPRTKRLLHETEPWLSLRWRSVSSLVKLSLPLGVVVMLVALNQHVPRYLISIEVGEYGLGIFTAIVYVALAAVPLVNALGQAASPRMSQAYAVADTHLFRSTLLKLLSVSTVFAVGGVAVAAVAGPQILRIVYSPDYAVFDSVLTAAMGVGGLVYLATCLGHTLTAMRLFKVQLPLLICVLTATSLTAVLAVSTWGLAGGIVAMGAGALVQTVGSGLLVYVNARRVASSKLATV